MNHTGLSVLAAVLSVAMSTAAATAEPAAAPASLGLAAARELVLANSAQLRKAVLAYDVAVLSEKAQAYKRLPSLSAIASSGSSLDYQAGSGLADNLTASARLSVSQTVYDGGKLAAQSRSGTVAVQAAAGTIRGARVDLVGQADAAFYAVLKAVASVEAADSDLEAATLRLELARAKAEAGVVAESDYLQAEAEAASRGTTRIKARKTLSSARARLSSMTGLAATFVVEPLDFARFDGLLARLSALDDEGIDTLARGFIAMAAEQNPLLAGYALAARKATIAVEAARSGYMPTVTAGLSQGVAYGAASGFSVGDGSLSLSATLSLDLWSTANSVRSAEAAAAMAELDGSAGTESLALDIEVAVNELMSSARTISSSATSLRYSESNYRNVLEKFRLSAASASELSAAEALVSAARTGLIGARYDFLSCLSELRGLVGLESEDFIVSAVQ